MVKNYSQGLAKTCYKKCLQDTLQFSLNQGVFSLWLILIRLLRSVTSGTHGNDFWGVKLWFQSIHRCRQCILTPLTTEIQMSKLPNMSNLACGLRDTTLSPVLFTQLSSEVEHFGEPKKKEIKVIWHMNVVLFTNKGKNCSRHQNLQAMAMWHKLEACHCQAQH